MTYADTGKPVPHAPIGVSSSPGPLGGFREISFRADGQGRFRVNPYPGDRFSLSTQSPDGQPYLIAHKQLDWPKGAVEQSVDLTLSRGVVIEGSVTEEGSGKPVAGAVVRFTAPRDRDPTYNMSAPAATRSDGSFQLAAVPLPGYLVVQGPSEDYVLREMGIRGGAFGAEGPGSRRFYAHAFTFFDLKSASGGLKVNLALRRGATVQGRIIGPDDRPVRDASIFSRVIVTVPSGGWKIWNDRYHGRAHDGRFELHGLDPDTEVPVNFLDAEHDLGATVHLSGKSAAGGPVTVRLDRCGAARARLVDRDGRALERRATDRFIKLIVTPGASTKRSQEKEGRLFANEASLTSVDPIHYPTPPASDGGGRIAFRALIPGATYRIVDDTTFADDNGPQIRKEFTVKPGENVDLGDILIEKPQDRR